MMTYLGKLRFVSVPLVLILCGWLARDSFAAPPSGYHLVWSDEFNSGAEIGICEHRSTDGASDIPSQVQSNVHSGGMG